MLRKAITILENTNDFDDMEFTAGQSVRFLNDVGSGIVVSHLGNMVRILREDGFEEDLPEEELVPIGSKDVLEEHLNRVEIRPKDQEVIRVSKSKSFTPATNVMEIDLHIHNLVENERQISKDKMLDIQLHHARKAIDDARKRNIKKLVLIHGIGQGVLRDAVIKLLDGYDRLQYYDASYQKYGKGATEVEFW
ncbi:MAG: Smr/MutS family protein [Cryomorphaceae bacterium]|nr:Smr/MutS family protein [Cryomorphaceae bacterium]